MGLQRHHILGNHSHLYITTSATHHIQGDIHSPWVQVDIFYVLAVLYIIHPKQENLQPAAKLVVQLSKTREKENREPHRRWNGWNDCPEACLGGRHRHCHETHVGEHSNEVRLAAGYFHNREPHVWKHRWVQNSIGISSHIVDIEAG